MSAIGREKLAQQKSKFFLQSYETPCFARLSPQRIGVAFNLGNNVGYAAKIRFCGFKPCLGRTLTCAELRNSSGFFDQISPVGRLCGQYLSNSSLLNYRVVRTRKPGSGKKILNIAKPTRFAVKLVFAFARKIKPAGNGNGLTSGKVEADGPRPPMPFRFDRSLDCLDRTGLSDMNPFHVEFFVVKSVRFSIDSKLLIADGFESFNLVQIDCIFVHRTQCFVNMFKFVIFYIKFVVIANHMQNDFGHAARFTIF